MRTFSEYAAVRMAGTPASWAAAAVNGNWIDMSEFRRCVFVCMNGELDGDLDVKVQEATSNVGANAANIAGLTDAFVNGTDEARVGIIEVKDGDLTSGYKYVSLLVTPAAADTFSAVAFLLDAYEKPASNTTTDGVAWDVSN